jgi:hypothetical protein
VICFRFSNKACSSLAKKEQKRLDVFLLDHTQQPLDVVARSEQHRMYRVIHLAFKVTAIKPMLRLQIPNKRFNGLAPACKLALLFRH